MKIPTLLTKSLVRVACDVLHPIGNRFLSSASILFTSSTSSFRVVVPWLTASIVEAMNRRIASSTLPSLTTGDRVSFASASLIRMIASN